MGGAGCLIRQGSCSQYNSPTSCWGLTCIHLRSNRDAQLYDNGRMPDQPRSLLPEGLHVFDHGHKHTYLGSVMTCGQQWTASPAKEAAPSMASLPLPEVSTALPSPSWYPYAEQTYLQTCSHHTLHPCQAILTVHFTRLNRAPTASALACDQHATHG